MGVVTLNMPNQPIMLRAAEAEASEPWHDVFRRQFADFAVAIRDGREPFIPGREGRRSIQLIEDCYASRQPLSQPWIYPIAKTGTD